MGWRWGDVYLILLILAKMLSLASCFTPQISYNFCLWPGSHPPSAPFILPNCVQHGSSHPLPAHRIKSQCLSRVFILCNLSPTWMSSFTAHSQALSTSNSLQRPALPYHWLLTRRSFLLWSTWRTRTPLSETCSNVAFCEMGPPAPRHLPEYFPKFSLSLEVFFSNHRWL